VIELHFSFERSSRALLKAFRPSELFAAKPFPKLENHAACYVKIIVSSFIYSSEIFSPKFPFFDP